MMPLVPVFDALLVLSVLVSVFDRLLRGLWRCVCGEDYRLIPLHTALVLALSLLTMQSGPGVAVRAALLSLWSSPLTEGQFDAVHMGLQVVGTLWLAWALGAICRYGIQCLKLRRRLGQARALTGESDPFRAAERCTGVEGIRRVEVDGLTSAGVFGLRRPVLLLPRGFCETYTEEEQRMIYTHELYHIRRRDTRWHFLLQLLDRLFFLHPPIRRQLRAVGQYREMRCDRLVAAGLSDPARYAQLILDQVSPEKRQYAAFSSDGYREVYARINALLTPGRAPYRRIGPVAVVLLLLGVALAGVPLDGYLAPNTAYVLAVSYTQEVDVAGDAPYYDACETALDGDTFFAVYYLNAEEDADQIMAGKDNYTRAYIGRCRHHTWTGVFASYAWGDRIKDY